MLRPRPARWFEILAARDDATLVLEALARTGAVELEARRSAGLPADFGALAPMLAQYQDLAARYRAYWPAPECCRPSAFPQQPALSLQRSLDDIRAWAAEAEPLIQALQRDAAEAGELRLWQRVMAALQARAVDAGAWAGAGPWLEVRLFVLPAGVEPTRLLPADAGGIERLVAGIPLDDGAALLAVGRPAALQSLAQAVIAHKGSVHAVPAGLQADATANAAGLAQRLAAIEVEAAALHAALDALHRRHELPRALGDAYRLQWVLQNVQALDSGELLCWVTGWSSDPARGGLAQALQASGARALLRFAPPPATASAPLLLSNPRWAQPFEIFSRALGMPAASEADPSPLLALAVPLLFGYMFGDLGQGLLIAAGGWRLRRRYPIARLLMIGGLAAAVFGLLFGSVFALHGVLPALWLHPLDAPLAVLMAPLAGGALLLTLGLGLDAMAAAWRGEFKAWLATDAALVPVYLGLLAAWAEPAALALAAVAALAFCIGHALHAGRWTAVFAAIGELIEKTLQILINTLSFARVGAFALAHAGLSSAIVALMDAAASPLAKLLVLVLGNALVIALEAMVVSIQTTRLVLFEFFTRFMRGQGRPFRPLPAPPYTAQET